MYFLMTRAVAAYMDKTVGTLAFERINHSYCMPRLHQGNFVFDAQWHEPKKLDRPAQAVD